MNEDNPPHISRHPPTEGDGGYAESREETIERVVGEEMAPEPVADATAAEDPSSRRGILSLVAGRWFWIGVGIGAGVGAIVALATWPVLDADAVGGDAGKIALAGAIVLAGAVIGGVLSVLVNVAREDGRIQREVEEDHPSASRGPGHGSDPQIDPPAER